MSIDFDGQSFIGDARDSGTGITPDHTPGEDARGDNGVVRTLDLVGYRLDYNVNEEGQTGATINLQLPPNMTWIPPQSTIDPATFPVGMFAGCTTGSSITSSGTAYNLPAPIVASVTGTNDILTCVVDTEDHEGNNGTIFPVAQLLLDIDDQTKTLTASLDTNEQPCGGAAVCSGSVDVISSGAPSANFQKGSGVKNDDGDIVSYEANEWFPMQRNGVDGWVSIWHITFNSSAGSLGGAPLNDTFPISFYDHYWDFTPGSVLATDTGDLTGTSIVPGRAACGALDTSVAPASAGTWTCTDVAAGVVELGLTGYDTATSSSPHSTAQIAIWSPLDELENKSLPQLINTISQSATPPTGTNSAVPIEFGGATGDPVVPVVLPESTVADNDAVFSYFLTTPGSGGGRDHTVMFNEGPYQVRETLIDGLVARSVDTRRPDRGGLSGLNGQSQEQWLGDKETPRGNIVTLTTKQSTDGSGEEAIHNCVAIDNTHANVIALPATFDVLDVTNEGRNAFVDGGYTEAPSHGLADVIVAEGARQVFNNNANPMMGVNELPASVVVVEFATAVNPLVQIDTPAAVTTPFSVVEDGVNCNNDSAVGSQWINSNDAAALAAAFDPDGDGRYQGIDLMRVRMLEPYSWAPLGGDVNSGVYLEASIQMQVLDDVGVEAAGSEIFAVASRAGGDWDPATANRPPRTECDSLNGASNQIADGGWCNKLYEDDANIGFGVPGGVLFYNATAAEKDRRGAPTIANADKLTIVEASIGINKVNLDGLTDIAENGDSVIFGIDVFTVGATADTLEDVTLIDSLPGRYQFVGFTQLPSSGVCTGGQNITCEFGDQPGGWSDYVEIEVVVVNSTASQKTENTAELVANRASADGPVPLSAESSAFSRSGTAFDEAAIIKAVNTIDGDCVLHPTDDPPPADWPGRCEMTDFATGQLLFDLTLTNEGNVAQTDVRFVDVFPHLADEAEAPSATGVVGDGRTPESDFAGDVEFVGFTGDLAQADLWVTADDPTTVSRDPDNAITDTTWCDAVNGTVQNGVGVDADCPADNAAITAIYAAMNDVPVGGSITGTLELVNTGHECDDIWTNTFGARHQGTLLPIRSNDVSIMVNCEFDLALEKIIDPAFAPGADWITPGVTTVDFLMEVTNQGDDIEDFHVTDYVDTSVFTFAPTDNPAGSTTGDATLPFIWDSADLAAPVAMIDGPLAAGDSVFIPVTLVIEDPAGPLTNWAEISYFDSDGDPSNGDSDPANLNNPSTGPLLDEDSTPDADQAGDAQPAGPGAPGDGEIGGDGSGTDPLLGDEDDHDVAGIPVYDLELIKTPATPTFDFSTTPPTVTFDITVTNQGNADAYLVDVTDYGAPGLTYVSATSTATGFTAANPTFTLDGPLAPAASETITVVYEMDLSQAPFTNAAEISAFDSDDDPSNPADPFAVDVDSTPDASDDDDVIDHDVQNNDPDGDGNLNEATPGDEDDHDIETVSPYDLALQKTFESAVTPLSPGGSVTMLITVTNQASPVSTIDITDYIDATMWQPFDATLNPDGSVHANSTAAGAFSFVWDATDPLNPVAAVTPDSGDQLAFGETITIPITLQPVDGFAAVAPLKNVAEISNFDNDEDPDNGDASDGTISDVDSTPDGDVANDEQPLANGDPGDDVIDGDGSGSDPVAGDEDDHDPVFIPVYDLELVKTVRDPGVDTTTTPWSVIFDVEVTNQGSDPVWTVDVADYPPTGLTYNPTATAALWSAETITGVTDASPTFTVAGPIAAGSSVTIPMVFDVTDLTAAPYVNAAEISAFDADDDPNNAPSPFAFDVDSTPDATNDDDVIDHTAPGYDPDGDGDLSEPTPGDEDDHDIAEVNLPFDLELRKRVDPIDPELADGIQNGDEISFFIEVFNSAATVEDFDVTDYITAGWSFDPAANPPRVTTAGSLGGPALPYTWTSTSATTSVAAVDGVLDTGESVFLEIVLTVDISAATDELSNVAEISRFDDDGDPTNGDSNPDNPDNPASGPLVDIDSTPDGDELNDSLTDDVIDGSNGDEDDHDIASTMWWDLALIKERSTTQPYILDPAANPLEVSFDLTVKNQGPADALNVSVVDVPPAGLTYSSLIDASGTVTSTAANEFTVASLAAGESVTFTVTYTVDLATVEVPSINSAEISGLEGDWDPDGPNGPLPAGVYPVADIDSTPDSDPTNDAITDDGIVDPADSHNDIDNDSDGDGNLHNADGIDEDDHDTEAFVLPFDLALQKTFVSMDNPLLPDGTVTMLVTVVNQGPAVELIEVTDYLDPSLWLGFDPALNPDAAVDPSSTATAAFSFVWDGGDPANPTFTVTPDVAGDKLLPGEAISVPITVQINPDFDPSTQLVNVAEISNFDSDQDPDNGDAADGTIFDIDSTPDSTDESTAGETIGGDLVDDALDGNGEAGNDEDDHDPVIIPVMDLALRKTIDPSTTFPISVGAPVTFSIEIINQGNVAVTNPTVIDYVDPAMWDAFDAGLNPAGTTGGAALAYSWAANANGQDGDVAITGTLLPGESVTVPVTLVIASGADLEALSNTAEITGGTASQADGTPITNPDGSPVVDIDSVPDADNSDPLTDDVIDGAEGDEDDHDIALVTPPTYNLGNQVWFDEDNNGILDPGETPFEGVVVELFGDADGDGLPDDLNGDGIIDSNDAIATDTTGPDGDYLFEDLAPGDYIVGIGPSNFEPDGALFATLPSDPVSSDPNDDVDGDNNGAAGPYDYVWSGPVTLDDEEPASEAGLNNDPNHPDNLSNLTVDFGFHKPVFDLALEKTLAEGQSSSISVGDDVTFSIEVINQGDVTAIDIEIIDYLPASMTLNDPDWTENTDGSATIGLPGPLAAGESTTVDITVTVSEAGDLDNTAEIAAATPVDVDGVALVMPNGEPFPDIDSVFDANDSDVLEDGVTDGDGRAGGDEDDHDIAGVTVAPASSAPPAPLAFTGGNALSLMFTAMILLAMGSLGLLVGRRRQNMVGTKGA